MMKSIVEDRTQSIESLLTLKQVANMLGVTPNTVRRRVNEGALDCVRIGKTQKGKKPRGMRFRRDQIDAFLRKRSS